MGIPPIFPDPGRARFRRHHSMDDPARRTFGRKKAELTRYATGLLLILAGVALGVHPAAGGATAHLVRALLALIMLGGGGYVLRRPLLAGAMGAVAAFVSEALATGQLWHPEAVVLAVSLGALSAMSASIAGRSVRGELTAQDGIIAVVIMLLLSIGLTVLSGVSAQSLAASHARLIVLIYLLTPPLEVTAVVAILLHKNLWRRFLTKNYGHQPDLGRHLAEGFMWGIGLILLTAVLVSVESRSFHVSIQPNNPFVYSPAVQRTPWDVAFLIALAVVVMAPLAEEALFRGLLYGGLRRSYGRLPAALLSAVIFGAAHMNASLFIPLVVAGLILAMIYERSASLWPSTVAHATLNGVSVVLALMIR